MRHNGNCFAHRTFFICMNHMTSIRECYNPSEIFTEQETMLQNIPLFSRHISMFFEFAILVKEENKERIK